MTIARLALASFATLLLAVPAQADPRQPPSVEYSATVTLTQADQGPVTQKIFYSKGRQRTEMPGHHSGMITIIDGPKKQVTVLSQHARQFEQWEHDGSDPGAPMAGQEIQIEKLGDEPVNGIPAVKSKITGKTPEGKPFEVMVWTSAQNIQLKMTGTDTIDGKAVAIGMELKDVKIGPLSPALFAVPAGYRRIPTPPPSQPAPPKK